MTSAAYTKIDLFRQKLKTIPSQISYLKKTIVKDKLASAFLLASITVFLFTRLYKLPFRFGFNHDTEYSANYAYSVIIEKKISLIGQETSIGGLFVGPFLNWLQTIVMFFANLNPLSLGYLAVFVTFINLILLFYVVFDLFGKKQALLATFLYAVSYRLFSYDISGSLVSYMMIASLVIILGSYKVFLKNKGEFLPLLFFGLAISFHIHLALLLLIPTVLLLFLIYKPKIKTKYILFSLALLIISFLPLIIFELRHNLLITNKLILLLKDQAAFSFNKLVETTNTYMGFLVESAIARTKYSAMIFILVITIFILLMIKEGKKKLLILLLIFQFTPLIFLYFYKSTIPEYYFLPIAPYYLITVSFVLSKLTNKLIPILILIVLVISVFNYNRFIKDIAVGSSFAFKNNIVDWIINDSKEKNFNVYYQIPHGENSGYKYLFKWKKHVPQENSENLYIIDYSNTTKFSLENYKKSFQQKVVLEKEFDHVHVISIK